MKCLRIALLSLIGIGVLTPGFAFPARGPRGFKNVLRGTTQLRKLLSSSVKRGIWQNQLRTLAEQGTRRPVTPTPSRKQLMPRSPLRLSSPEKVSIPQLSQAQHALLSKQNVDAFIFDLDGTLLDSLDAWENSAVNYLRSRGIEPHPGLQEEMEELSLLDGARIIKERYQLTESIEELVAATLKPIGEHYYNDIPAKTYIPSLLEYLHKQGIKMVIATASHADFARGALERLGLLDYFEFIITCDEVGKGKRSPLVYEVATQRLGTEKSRTVVVEDAFYALKTAHEAGFKTIGVADAHSVNDIPKIQQTADLFLNLE